MKSSPSLLKKIFSSVILVCMLASLSLLPVTSTAVSLKSHIVQGVDVDTVAALVQRYGGQVTSRLEIVQGVGAILPVEAVAALLQEDAIRAVTRNGEVRLVGSAGTPGSKKDNWPATDYPDVVGADVTWEQGVTGKDITVAIVDTGVAWHPGLFRDVNGKVVKRIIAWKDFVSGSRVPVDPNGHGTHLVGVMANTHIGADGEWNGVAPGVNIVAVRVLDRQGYGTYETVLKGIQWVVENKDTYNIRVLNLSLVAPVQSPYWADPLNQATMQAWAAGIVVVAAAGNGGPDPLSIGVPGNNPYVITVGAFTDNYTPYDWNDDYIAPFSAAGPTLDGFVKPDVVAPGGHIVSTMMPGSYLLRQYKENKVSQFYFSMAGTSQSAAVVSGIAALVTAAHPELTPNQVKYRIMSTAFPWVNLETSDALYSVWQQGSGRVNAVDAVFTDASGEANYGMDLAADLAGTTHYEGFSTFDEANGEFRLRGDFSDWTGGYGNWSGGYGNWSGGYGNWSGGYGNWSGGYGNWSGGYGNWSGGYGNWSGGYGNWSGGYGNWSGGYGNWLGGYGNWSGGYGNWSGGYVDPVSGTEATSGDVFDWTGAIDWTGSISIQDWVEESQP
jgi:serine protease AprX